MARPQKILLRAEQAAADAREQLKAAAANAEALSKMPYGARFMHSLKIRYDGMDVSNGINSQQVIDAIEGLVTDDNFEIAESREDVLGYARGALQENGVSSFNLQNAMLILNGVCDHCQGTKMPGWDPAHQELG